MPDDGAVVPDGEAMVEGLAATGTLAGSVETAVDVTACTVDPAALAAVDTVCVTTDGAAATVPAAACTTGAVVACAVCTADPAAFAAVETVCVTAVIDGSTVVAEGAAATGAETAATFGVPPVGAACVAVAPDAEGEAPVPLVAAAAGCTVEPPPAELVAVVGELGVVDVAEVAVETAPDTAVVRDAAGSPADRASAVQTRAQHVHNPTHPPTMRTNRKKVRARRTARMSAISPDSQVSNLFAAIALQTKGRNLRKRVGEISRRRLPGDATAATEQIAFSGLLRSGDFERHLRRMRACYRKRRDRFLNVLAERAPTARPVGISAGLRVLLELPPTSPSSTEIAERAMEHSISLFPGARCYHGGLPANGRDGLVLGYAALPEHDFESGIAALGDLLGEELGSSPDRLPRPRPLSHNRVQATRHR